MSKNKLEFDEVDESEMASNYSEGASDAKKPCKGILKTSSSFDRPALLLNHRKSAKFDELNVLQTFHPADKDYGHMKIDEPKTPYRVAEGEEDSIDQLDAEVLAEKLRTVQTPTSTSAGRSSSFSDFDDSGEDEARPHTTPEQQRLLDLKLKDFENRRKAHYNEFEAVRRARLLMQNDDDDDDEDEDENGDAADDHDDDDVDDSGAEDGHNNEASSTQAASSSAEVRASSSASSAISHMEVDSSVDSAKSARAAGGVSSSSSPTSSTLVADDV